MVVEIIAAIGMIFLSAFWIMVPAYIPNPAAALLGGGTPIDFGKCAKDGRRIFGDGKTWRGLIGGIIVGILFGLFQMFLYYTFNLTFLPEHSLWTIIPLSIGALLGDLIKSYFKRRLGKERGSKWPIADMYDMVVGSLVLMVIVLLISGGTSWFTANLVDPLGILPQIVFGLAVLIAIFVVSPLMHRGTNIIAYMFKLKDVPW
ncbi:MAG TPA: CDP-2,3-bis-(O-geranylgeranyl)-sn-glycerol synthase [Methanocorpusculum sp.]|nr:CDP-2,3-bis-(O-geranylgeranyl)-sn-glycerol synthase [Methanocorpusculum sp.]